MQCNEPERGHGESCCLSAAELHPCGDAAGHAPKDPLRGLANNANPAWDFGLHQAHAPWLVGNQNQGPMILAMPRP